MILELLQTFIGLIFWFTLAELGVRVGNRWWSTDSPTARLANALALGPVLVALLALLLSALGGLETGCIGCVQVLLLLPLLRKPRLPQLLREACVFGGQFVSPVWPGLLLGMSLVGALAPTTHTDTLVYHYTLPQLYLRHRSLYWTGTSVFDGTFHALHLLYAWAMAIGGERCASLTGPYSLLILGLAVSATVEPFLPRAQTLGMCLAWLSPVIVLESYGGLSDLPAAAYSAMALLAWSSAARSNRRQHWELLCLWAAVAVSIRLTSGAAVLSLALAAACLAAKRQASPLRCLQLGLTSAFFCAPWMIWNALNTGDPLYPIGATWSAHDFVAGGGQAFPWNLLLPLAPHAPDRSWQDSLNPLLVAGAILLPLCSSKGCKPLAWPGLAFLAIVGCLHLKDPRYALEGSIWLAPLAALGLGAALEQRPRLTRAVLVAGTGCGLLTAAATLGPRLAVVAGWQKPADYLRSRVPVNDAYLWMASRPEARVFLTDPRAFRCPFDFCVLGQEDLRPAAWPFSATTPKGLERAYQSKGCDLILWDFGSVPSIRAGIEEEPGGLADTLVGRAGLDKLNAIRPNRTAIQPKDYSSHYQDLRLRALYRLTRKGRVVFSSGKVVLVEWPGRKTSL